MLLLINKEIYCLPETCFSCYYQCSLLLLLVWMVLSFYRQCLVRCDCFLSWKLRSCPLRQLSIWLTFQNWFETGWYLNESQYLPYILAGLNSDEFSGFSDILVVVHKISEHEFSYKLANQFNTCLEECYWFSRP